MEKISVIIPCRNEEKYIANCLNSIIKNDYPKDFIEVFVVDGLSNDSTRDIVEGFSKKYSFIFLLINENKTAPYAMNLGIEKSTGEYIIRLDAHGEIPNNYFSTLIEWGKKLNADNTGAVWITDVINKTPKSLSIVKVLSNKFGVGNSLFRIGIDSIKEVDTVPFGCYKKSVFRKIGLYNERLKRNQDIELNKRLKKNGGHIFLLPHLFSTYYARESFSGIAKNNFQTGFWNMLTVYYTKTFSSLSLRHFIPLMFCLSIIVPLILMIWYLPAGLISAAILLIYFTVMLSTGIRIKETSTPLHLVLCAFIVLHFSYGFGSALGLFRIDILFGKTYR